VAHEHARENEADTDKPWVSRYVPRKRTAGWTGGWEKRGMDVSRWFSSYCAKEERGVWGWEKFRLTSWKCLKRRTPTLVGTRALSVSHSKFSFPTSVSTVPLLYSPVPPPSLLFASTPFHRFRGQVSGVESNCVVPNGVPRSKPFLGRESGVLTRARAHACQHGAVDSGPVRANLADQTGTKSCAFVRVNSIHELSIFPTFSSLHHFPSGAMLFLAAFPPLVPPPARVLLPRRARPFQSMSSRQRAFRYF